jgi:hypothetical protein
VAQRGSGDLRPPARRPGDIREEWSHHQPCRCRREDRHGRRRRGNDNRDDTGRRRNDRGATAKRHGDGRNRQKVTGVQTPLHAGKRPGALSDLQQVSIRQAFTVADAALAGFDSRGRLRRCCPPANRPLRSTPSSGSGTTGGGGIRTSGGTSTTPSGLSAAVPATVFAATAQAAELASKSSVRGFMVTVGNWRSTHAPLVWWIGAQPA